jgi:hypothetical protein
MPDWQKLVRERLSGLVLDATEKEEVHAELAAHLEESYEGFRKRGLLEKEAAHRALEQVSDWQQLLRNIVAAKRREHPMKKRVPQLWIPGFLMLILSMLSLVMLQRQGFHPRNIWSGPNTILFYVPWLVSLPFFGALGTFLASRAGGSRGTALLASVFPVLALTGAFLLMFPIGWVDARIIGRQNDFSSVATAILGDGIGWLLLPGGALFAGGLIVQIFLAARSSSQRTVMVQRG